MYAGIVTLIKSLSPIENADRLKLASILDTTVVVGLEQREGEKGVYFPCDGVFEVWFAEALGLLQKNEVQPDGSTKNVGGYLDRNNPRIRAISLRGQISDGLFIPMSSFVRAKLLKSEDDLAEGALVHSIQDRRICSKYVSSATKQKLAEKGAENKKKVKKTSKTTYDFPQHLETQHYAKVSSLLEGKLAVVTEKLHGTSHRVGNVRVSRQELSTFGKVKAWFRKVFNRELPFYEPIHGTRRVDKPLNGGFYQGTNFREKITAKFIELLEPGEIVYGEIVGKENGTYIMHPQNLDKVKDKKLRKELSSYENPVTYMYGSDPYEFYVYRITRQVGENEHLDLSYHAMAKRAQQLGLKVVPLLYEGVWSDKVLDELNVRIHHPSVLGGFMEGIVIRIDNGLNPQLVKYKTLAFRILEDLVKEDCVDTEEAEGESEDGSEEAGAPSGEERVQ